MAEKLYDLEPLNTLVEGNEKFRKYLIELFIQTTPPILADIQSSYKEGDWTSLYGHAHKLKPTLDSMGIYTMKEVLNTIMQHAKSKKDGADLASQVLFLCTTIDNVIVQLQHNEL
jgi:hypothetical protein